MIVENPAQRF